MGQAACVRVGWRAARGAVKVKAYSVRQAAAQVKVRGVGWCAFAVASVSCASTVHLRTTHHVRSTPIEIRDRQHAMKR